MKRPDPKNYKPTDFIRGVYENDLEKYIDYLEQNQAAVFHSMSFVRRNLNRRTKL